ncbi:methyltransferase domain-containing protein [Thiothrix sp.]|jgi:uncharacterized protein YbaR (Trm112 family)/SAM-dependent methyltransferase|uniref:methyltransferase domain-containing protein n=1 Tax=Thiothrix sp. TaxID=1032 RepID=UPI00257F339E|nr:methyltransferase domain-containing protein [Thiothrix sp.]
MKTESKLMFLAKQLGLNKLRWSLRRLHIPVNKDALVLEVGSGGNPYFRSNVLLDAYEETRERHWVPLVSDRPTVLGFVENLPFKDKSFDFVIASHVLEHSPYPEKFLAELQRVAKAGYIEVPDAFMERINPYHDHRLEITVRNHKLIILKKQNWKHDPEIVELYDDRVKSILTQETMRRHPFEFHVRYYWSDTIDFIIANPDTANNWQPPSTQKKPNNSPAQFRARLNNILLQTIRKYFSQNKRNQNIQLIDLLSCPLCNSSNLEEHERNTINCKNCGENYPVIDGIPKMLKRNT